MRIERIEALPAPVEPDVDYLLCRVTSSDGAAGVGEAYPIGPTTAVVAVVEQMAEWLVGKDARDISRLWYEMYLRSRFPGGSILNAAISGIELALWDLLGKSVGLPVHQLLGGRCRDRVRVYQGVHEPTPAACAATAKDLVATGMTAVKLTPFAPEHHRLAWHDVLDGAIERIGTVRDTLGTSVDIAVDAHAQIADPARALELARVLEPFGVLFLEEPLRPENVDSLAALRRRSPIPIATGEMLYTAFSFRELLAKGAVDVVQPDICLCGGLTEARKIAALAECEYVPIAPHNPLGPFATAASLHLAASVQNFSILEYVPSTTGLRRALTREALTYADGHLELPTGPGWGLELAEEAIPDRAVKDWSRDPLRRGDGSVQEV